MGFVDDHTAPGNITQLRTVRQNHLKRSDDGVKLIGPLYHSTLWGHSTSELFHRTDYVPTFERKKAAKVYAFNPLETSVF